MQNSQVHNRIPKDVRDQMFRINMDEVIRETKKQPPPPKQESVTWIGYLITAAVVTLAVAAIRTPEAPKPAYQGAIPVATPAPLPEVAVPRALPVPVPRGDSAPRAKLVHLRALGSFENNRMPDGRVLLTKYKGELASAASLPTYGANLGDMWFTQNDGHAWVLAPLANSPGSIGWIDP